MEKLDIKLLDDRVLILADPEEEVTAGGIIIPDASKEKPKAGTIVAIGTKIEDSRESVKVGDKVLFGKYAGSDLTYKDNDYLVMRITEVIAVI